MPGRFEPHSHTAYSNTKFVDSLNKPKELIDRAVQLGLSGIAITDHSCIGAHVIANQYGLEVQKDHPEFKVALGEESYLCETRDKNQYYYHQIFIAKNKVGHKMLRELSSMSWERGYHDRGIFRTPIMYDEMEALIGKYGKGNLIATSACLAGTLNHNLLLMINAENDGDADLKKKHHSAIVKYMRWMQKWFGDDFYIEVAPGRSSDQMKVNSRMVSVAKAFGKKIVVGTDSHYLSPELRATHKAFLTAKSSSDREVDDFYYYAYLQSDDECREYLDGTGVDFDSCVDTSMEIYDKIEDYSLFHTQQVPQIQVADFPKKKGSTGYPTLDYLYGSDEVQERYWINRCVDELERRGLKNDEYLSRLEEEADTQKFIGEKLDTCIFAYSNLMEYCINTAWSVGSCVGVARGSGGAGLNHYLLGITQIDPVKYGLNLYFRFLNKERVELPDVDFDISPLKRNDFFEKIRSDRESEFGCVQVCTYGTVGSRSAVLTACRGYRSKEYPNGIDSDTAQYISSIIPAERGFNYTISDMVDGNEEKGRTPNQTFINEVGKYPGLLDIIRAIEGVIDHIGIHASGVVLEDADDICKYSAFMRVPSGAIVTQFSLHDDEFLGETKIDSLITEEMEIIGQTVQLLQKYGYFDSSLSLKDAYYRYVSPDVLPMEDGKLWDTIDQGNTLALFQFNTLVGGQTVRLLKPRNLTELTAANSLMRLMPEKGEETPSEKYARFSQDKSLWYQEMDEYGLTKDEQKSLEPYLKDSHGICYSQEQIMLIVMDPAIAGYSLKESNSLRKLIARFLAL